MKRTCLMMVVVALSAMMSGTEAVAGERQAAPVPAAVLADLGLGGMQTMPDAAGDTVRGKTGIHLGASPIEAVPFGKDNYQLILPLLKTKELKLILPTAASDGIRQALLVPPIKKE